jgi:peptidoglycan hydrolase-like protein with peptidoglycan-binding domain
MPASALDYLGAVPAATRARAAEILEAVEAAGHRIYHVWGMGGSAEHATGRALDFMVYTRDGKGTATGIDHAAGDFVRDYAWTHRARLGLIHAIWDQTIVSTDPRFSPGVIREMPDRGNATENHKDHVHLLFDEVPYVAPGRSVPVDRVSRTNPRKPRPQELTVENIDLSNADRKLVTGPGVKPMQRLLGVTADGKGGSKTKAALNAYQRRVFGKADNVFGPVTASALLAGK